MHEQSKWLPLEQRASYFPEPKVMYNAYIAVLVKLKHSFRLKSFRGELSKKLIEDRTIQRRSKSRATFYTRASD